MPDHPSSYLRPLLSLASLCALLSACGAGVEAEPCDPEDLSCEASTDLNSESNSESRGDTGADTSAESVGDIAQGAGEGDGALEEEPQPEVCAPIDGWQPGAPLFIRKTEAWGLKGVEGSRLSVTDLDGDGWPDVMIRNGGGPDDFNPGGDRSRWILRNTQAGAFEDVTESSGLLTYRLEAAPRLGRPGDTFTSGDVDNDGDLDVFVGQTRTLVSDTQSPTSELMLNQGDGTFVLGPIESDARFRYRASKPAGVAFLDYNLDGYLDLWVVHNEQPGPTGLPDYLLAGDGTGHFEDRSEAMGLKTGYWNSVDALNSAQAHSWGWSGAACDLNLDGLPELLAASYGRMPNHLWRALIGSDGATGGYQNVSIDSGYAFDHRADWTDNVSAQCHCRDNPQDAECDTVPSPPSDAMCQSFIDAFGGYRWNHASGREPYSLGGNSATTVCGDVDNDGWPDLLTGEIVHWDVGSSSDPAELLFNTQDPLVRFVRPGNEVTGLVRVDEYEGWDRGDMTMALFDMDNDGWQDVYIGSSDYPGNRALLYRQVAPQQFEEFPLSDTFSHYRAHGVAVADFDRDGDMDLIIGHSLMRCDGFPGDDCKATPEVDLYENQAAQSTRWVALHLVGGPGTNRSAIGARVTLTAGGTTQTRVVDGGHGHFGLQSDMTLHFGLGQACEAEVSVYWPDKAQSSEVYTLSANQRYRITQGGTLEAL